MFIVLTRLFSLLLSQLIFSELLLQLWKILISFGKFTLFSPTHHWLISIKLFSNVPTIKSSGLVIAFSRLPRSCSDENGPSLLNVIFHSLKNRSISLYFIAVRNSRNTSLASVSSSTKKRKSRWQSVHFCWDLILNFDVDANKQNPNKEVIKVCYFVAPTWGYWLILTSQKKQS